MMYLVTIYAVVPQYTKQIVWLTDRFMGQDSSYKLCVVHSANKWNWDSHCAHNLRLKMFTSVYHSTKKGVRPINWMIFQLIH